MKIYLSTDTASVFHQFWTLLVLFGRPHCAPQACCTSSGHCWIPRKPMRQSAAAWFVCFGLGIPPAIFCWGSELFSDDFSRWIFHDVHGIFWEFLTGSLWKSTRTWAHGSLESHSFVVGPRVFFSAPCTILHLGTFSSAFWGGWSKLSNGMISGA